MHCVYAHAWWCMMYTFNAGSITCIYATGGSYCIIKLTREWEMADDDDEVVIFIRRYTVEWCKIKEYYRYIWREEQTIIEVRCSKMNSQK